MREMNGFIQFHFNNRKYINWTNKNERNVWFYSISFQYFNNSKEKLDLTLTKEQMFVHNGRTLLVRTFLRIRILIVIPLFAKNRKL